MTLLGKIGRGWQLSTGQYPSLWTAGCSAEKAGVLACVLPPIALIPQKLFVYEIGLDPHANHLPLATGPSPNSKDTDRLDHKKER